MSQVIYNSPRVYIGKTEIKNFSTINYKNSGSNKISTLGITITDPEMDDAALLGKEVIFYLNYGSTDTVPFFRGFIKQLDPSDKAVKIIAHDVLTYLAGSETPPLVITDASNFDGFTLGQMLHHYIENVVNRNKVRIGLDMLNDTDPPVTLTGYRNKKIHPLKIVQTKIPKNTSVLSDIKTYRLVVRDDGTKSNICFAKEQDIDSAGITFTYNDGIEKLTYKKRPDPNYYTVEIDGNVMEYQHNSLPTGITMGKMTKKDFKYPDEARMEAFLEATAAENKIEINLTTSKGHYLELGNVINISTPEISGKHRILSKSVSCGSKVTCKLKLSKEAPVLSDFISDFIN
jgi:hypothetical protein